MITVPPRRIGKFELEGRIGHGGMGEVFRARDTVLDRAVAIKLLSIADDERKARFEREARVAARLQHPGIVVIHEFGVQDGLSYLAMELLAGSDLSTRIARDQRGGLDERLRMMEDIAEAIGYAHSLGVIHRDVKPANVFVLPDGRVKILDFGLARIGTGSLTRAGGVMGSPNYMSPEQVRGDEAIDARADVYSLGAVFYELLCGRRAIEGTSIASIFYKVLNREPTPLAELAPETPAGIAKLVDTALAKDARKRFADAREFLAALRAERTRVGEVEKVASLAGLVESPSPPEVSVRPAPKADSSSRTLVTGESGTTVIFLEPGEQSIPLVPLGPDETLLQTSLRGGLPHANACGGMARCSTCRVQVLAGAENLTPRTVEEQKLARMYRWSDDTRLACQVKMRGEATVKRLVAVAGDALLSSTLDSLSLPPSQERPLALLHARLRGFGEFARRHLVYDVAHVLHRVFSEACDPVFSCNGSLERYREDGFLALFGLTGNDPRTRCLDAARAAIRMRRRMEALNGELRDTFGFEVQLDVALHYGRVVCGELGHPKQRRSFALGEPVGVVADAARLGEESGYGIVATESFVNLIEEQLALGASFSHVLGANSREHLVFELSDLSRSDTIFLVQTSFDRMAARIELASRIFYDTLFRIAPQVRTLFANTDMGIQGRMLMDTLAAAVRSLDDLESLRPTLVELGRRHVAYGTRLDHYAAVEEALLATLAEILGPDFDQDTRLAWVRMYGNLAQVMIEASIDVAA